MDNVSTISKSNKTSNGLGKRIYELRKQKGLTQAEFSARVNIARGSCGNYETEERDPNGSILVKIADFFNISTDYLLGRTNNTILPYEEHGPVEKYLNIRGITDEDEDLLKTMVNAMLKRQTKI